MVLGRLKPKICKSVVGLTSYSIINGVDCGVIADLFEGCLLLWLNVNWTRGYAGGDIARLLLDYLRKNSNYRIQFNFQFLFSILPDLLFEE